MTAIEAEGLGKRHRRRWALRGCDLVVPEGRIVGLVGANGAGKTTLLHLAVGLQRPTEGVVRTLGTVPRESGEVLPRIGFLAQDAPTYGHLTVGEHLRLGRALNPGWDDSFAHQRVARLDLDPHRRAAHLSGGQRAQLALTLALGKRPELLVLDEPAASLDPLARRQLLQDLMEIVAEDGPTVVLSSHMISDVERICDHLIVLGDGRVRVEGAVDELLAEHKVLTGSRRPALGLPGDQQVLLERTVGRQTTVVVRSGAPVLDPHWDVADIGLEELVLAYMAAQPGGDPDRPLAVAS